MEKKVRNLKKVTFQGENASDQSWDGSMRSLVRADPMAFIRWFMLVTALSGEITFLHALPEKLKTWKLETDALLKMVLDGQEIILHIEFQAYNDDEMAERLLRYNVLIRSEYKLPVISYVIYLLRDGKVPASPLKWITPLKWDNETCELLKFHFLSIELGQLSPEELLATDLPGLLPLLPLTKNGATTEVVEYMLQGLEASNEKQKEELLTVGSLLATLIFQREKPDGLNWLYRRLRSMREFLRESPLYQDILSEGIEKGMEQGIEKGMEQGIEKGMEKGRQKILRELLVGIVKSNFPEHLWLVESLLTRAKNQDMLQGLILKLYGVTESDSVRDCLVKANEECTKQGRQTS